MSDRNTLLARVRANKPGFAAQAPEIPLYDDHLPTDQASLEQQFTQALNGMGGAWAEPATGETLADTMHRALGDRMPAHPSIVSNTPHLPGNRPLDAQTPAAALHDVDIAILPARFAIAETGSVVLTEHELVINALAYLAQHLVVLLDPQDLEINLHHAYRRNDFQQARYTVFHTGPSATADIEGVLVRGAQGVRSLTVIPVRGEGAA